MPAFENFPETGDGIVPGNIRSGAAGECLGDEEGLREEPLDFSRAVYDELVLL